MDWKKAFGTAHSVLKDMGEGIKKQNAEIAKIKEKYANKSTEDLIDIALDDSFFGPSSNEKTAARSILKDRGELDFLRDVADMLKESKRLDKLNKD